MRYLLLALIALAAPSGAAVTQDKPYTLANTLVHSLNSPENGEYKIMVSWPEGKAPPEGWPVIYLLDGESVFPGAVSLMQRLTCERCPLTPGVVVAIDYPGDSRRERDYRPTVDKVALEPNPAGGTYPPGAPGEAQKFWRFIDAELRPWVAQHWKINPQRQALFGHSYGGLFTTWLFMTSPDAFQHFYASSPSVWWNDRYLLRMAQNWQPDEGHTQLSISVGGYEQSLQPQEARLPEAKRAGLLKHRGQRAMVDGNREMANALIAKAPHRVDFTLVEGQSHLTVAPLVLHGVLINHFAKSE
ncbi:alpha/beta hydrolase [Cedecea sp. P7760]|uniref:alpha/beta hydrolase n=1 Tax=Cedecea sp. P7760 TaxID=2726983 RepID=UPI0015A2173A|nr:alpha/beta hydrolase-fold protein [Cedecea sp. P7760]NWC64245.1 alpha/beta hydrolase [Cedecea sp. P7760]